MSNNPTTPRQPGQPEGGAPNVIPIEPNGPEMDALGKYQRRLRGDTDDEPLAAQTLRWTDVDYERYGLGSEAPFDATATQSLDDTRPTGWNAADTWQDDDTKPLVRTHGERRSRVSEVERFNYEPIPSTFAPGDSFSAPESVYLPEGKHNQLERVVAMFDVPQTDPSAKPTRMAVQVEIAQGPEGGDSLYKFIYVDEQGNPISLPKPWNPRINPHLVWQGVVLSVADYEGDRYIEAVNSETGKPHRVERMQPAMYGEGRVTAETAGAAELGATVLTAAAPDALTEAKPEAFIGMHELENNIRKLDETLTQPELAAANRAYIRLQRTRRDQARFYKEQQTPGSDLDRRHRTDTWWLEGESDMHKGRVAHAEELWLKTDEETRRQVKGLHAERSNLVAELRGMREADIAERYRGDQVLDSTALVAMKTEVAAALDTLGNYGLYTRHVQDISTVITGIVYAMEQWKGIDGTDGSNFFFSSDNNPRFRRGIIKPLESMPNKAEDRRLNFDQMRDSAPRGVHRPSRATTLRELIGSKTIQYEGEGARYAADVIEALFSTMVETVERTDVARASSGQFVTEPEANRYFLRSVRQLLHDANAVDDFRA